MSRTGRSLVALVGAPLVLMIATWFDTVVLSEAIQRSRVVFDLSGIGLMTTAGTVLDAGAVLLVGMLAWRAGSAVVGVVYAVVGAFIAGLPWLVLNLATGSNGAPSVLPEPLSIVLADIYSRTASGSLNAAGTIGAAMLIAGVVSLARWPRDRAAASGAAGTLSPAAGPRLP